MNFIDFEYDKERLSDYGMTLCKFNGNGNIETMPSGADISFNQIKPSGSDKFRLYSSIYESAYTATFQICKNPCDKITDETMYLTPDEVSAIQRWLCRKNSYRIFKIDQIGYENIFWKSTFSSKQVMVDGHIIGLELTMFTDCPYAYEEIRPIEFNCKANEPFTVYDMSDEEGYIYPSVEIQFLGKGIADLSDPSRDIGLFTFELSNSLDKKTTKIKNCSINETIKIDGESLIISSSGTPHPSLANDFNYFFPKIINSYSNRKNDFTANADCKVIFWYSPIRKIGL